MKQFYIKESSFLAQLATAKLQKRRAAIVFGNTIHLYGVSKEDFLGNISWLRHELKHVEQYERMGKLKFIATYLWQTAFKGYYNSQLETEARHAENDETIISRFKLKK